MSATLIRALPAAREHSRMQTVATWLFLLPLLASGIVPDVVKLQLTGLAVLSFAVIASRRSVLPRAVERITAAAAVLTLLVIAYIILGRWPQDAGTTDAYDGRAVLWAIIYLAVAVFAVLFFEPDLFERVIWRSVTFVLSLSIAACLFSRLTGHVILVNPAHGTMRMAGTMSEPAEWGALLSLIVLQSIRRRSWPGALLAVTGLVLADSPTCILVISISLPLYYGLAGAWRYRAFVLVSLAVIIPVAVVFVQNTNTDAWLASGNTSEVAVARLISGLQNVGTDGQQGTNTRFSTTSEVIAATSEEGTMGFGAGPGADAVYFPAKFPSGPQPVAANALWVSTLFDLGEAGVAVLAVLVLAALWRMRHFPAICSLLVPFSVSSAVNSSVPDYSILMLGILLFAFGWYGTRNHPAGDQDNA